MRKVFIVAIVCFFATGCGVVGSGTASIEKEAFPVVEKYLENAAAGNWEKVFETLSGEALTEAKVNAGRVKAAEKIISKSLKATPVCKDIVVVSADFTKSAGGECDRLAYNFKLKKTGDRWLIYKTVYGNYHRGQLKPGQLPTEAAEIIKTYLEIPFEKKRNDGSKYLAGELLQESEKAKLLPADTKTVSEKERILTRVKDWECLGVSEGYAVARVNYDLLKDGLPRSMEAIIEMVAVNGTWKICEVDISQI
ncbi:MAG: hypothetical protein ACOY40_05420 [Bacillota bacterium]